MYASAVIKLTGQVMTLTFDFWPWKPFQQCPLKWTESKEILHHEKWLKRTDGERMDGWMQDPRTKFAHQHMALEFATFRHTIYISLHTVLSAEWVSNVCGLWNWYILIRKTVGRGRDSEFSSNTTELNSEACGITDVPHGLHQLWMALQDVMKIPDLHQSCSCRRCTEDMWLMLHTEVYEPICGSWILNVFSVLGMVVDLHTVHLICRNIR